MFKTIQLKRNVQLKRKTYGLENSRKYFQLDNLAALYPCVTLSAVFIIIKYLAALQSIHKRDRILLEP